MRLSTACLACRNRRRKCEITGAGLPCTYCFSRRIQCTGIYKVQRPSSYQLHLNKNSKLRGLNGGASHPMPSATEIPRASLSQNPSMPPQALCVELVNLYFDYVHDQFHSLFHRPTFERDISRGKVPPVVLYAMMALSARFSTNPVFAAIDPRDRTSEYMKESERLLDLRDASLTTIQACVLLGAICISDSNGYGECVYYSTACRIAMLLDLANRPTVNGIERETNLRVWWSLWMIDTWTSDAMRLPKVLSKSDGIPLPMNETVFDSANAEEDYESLVKKSSLESKSSLIAEMVKLNGILHEINEYNNKKVAAQNKGLIIEDEVDSLSKKLDEWEASIPECMRDTPENLTYWASEGLGRTFTAVHFGHYHFGQLICYQFLHEDCHSSTPDRAHFYATKCKSYAARLCQLTYAAHNTPGCDVLYNMVGHVLVISSTVQIHTLLFSEDESQIKLSRTRLEKNYEMLTKLRQYWPTLDLCFARLRAFHKACLQSMDTSFRLDQWMLTFLSHFSTPIDDKCDDEWTIAEIGTRT